MQCPVARKANLHNMDFQKQRFVVAPVAELVYAYDRTWMKIPSNGCGFKTPSKCLWFKRYELLCTNAVTYNEQKDVLYHEGQN